MTASPTGNAVAIDSRGLLGRVWLAALTLGGVLITAVPAMGQCEARWLQAGPETERVGHCAAYDAARQQVVMFGGRGGDVPMRGDTLVWDGDQWRTAARTGPSPRHWAAMAYDAARQRVVMFGGYDTIIPRDFNETWLWDGTSWTQIAVPGPSGRHNHAMAYDYHRQCVVLFGGTNRETWEWDGASWTWKGAHELPTQLECGMAYDPVRQQVILFGGAFQSVANGNTYAWDGTDWTLVATTGPEGREVAAMSYDPIGQRVLMYGGYKQLPGGGDKYFTDTWSWNGSSWTKFPFGDMTYGTSAASAFDEARGRFLISGGWRWVSGGPVYESGTRLFDGAGWSSDDGIDLLKRRRHAAAFDRERGVAVVFGGIGTSGTVLGDTVEWAGDAWERVATTGPDARQGHAMAYDTQRGMTVLFGGADGSGVNHGDTWLWDGSAWTAAAGGPAARQRHAVAYDPERGRLVLFGGQGNSGLLGDTWEWDGSAWMQMATTGPSPRMGFGMTFDSVTHRVVLFGGDASGETWEWDGSAWSLRSTGETAIEGAPIVYDELSTRIARYGGRLTSGGYSTSLWLYQAGDWFTQNPLGLAPMGRTDHAMVYDTVRRAVLLVGGESATLGQPVGDAWMYKVAGYPTITVAPEAVSVAEGRSAQFHVGAVTPRLERQYRWNREGTRLRGDGDRIRGYNTAYLTIKDVRPSDAGLYTCDVADDCGETRTTAVLLTVMCRADLTADGQVDFADYLEFLNLFDTPSPDANLNDDGLVDFADYLEFLNLFAAGC